MIISMIMDRAILVYLDQPVNMDKKVKKVIVVNVVKGFVFMFLSMWMCLCVLLLENKIFENNFFFCHLKILANGK